MKGHVLSQLTRADTQNLSSYMWMYIEEAWWNMTESSQCFRPFSSSLIPVFVPLELAPAAVAVARSLGVGVSRLLVGKGVGNYEWWPVDKEASSGFQGAAAYKLFIEKHVQIWCKKAKEVLRKKHICKFGNHGQF